MNDKFEPDFPVSDMTIQDYFAGLAMQSLISHRDCLDMRYPDIAEEAYDMATNMLASRKLWTSSHDLTYIPSEAMCKRCTHIYGDCSELSFKDMPIIKRNADGATVVKCLNFEKVEK